MQFVLPYHLRWCYVILDNVPSSFKVHKLLRMRYLNPSFFSSFKRSFRPVNLFVGVTLGYISPKAFHWECCYSWCLSMIQVFSYPLGERSFHLFVDLKQAIVSVVAELCLNFEKFSISPLQAHSFRCWFSNNSVITFLVGCFPSSFVAEVGIFFSILLFQ